MNTSSHSLRVPFIVPVRASAPAPDRMISAVQDRGCLSTAKFILFFPDDITHAMAAAFGDCQVLLRDFSNFVPLAKDLLSIKREHEFSAECIVGARKAVVHFIGSASDWPVAAMEAFARRLRDGGYGNVAYARGPGARCDPCTAGVLKGCQRHAHD